MRVLWGMMCLLAIAQAPAGAVLLDPTADPDADPWGGGLSPMSLGQPAQIQPLAVARPLHLVVGPDGRQHGGGVNMAGAVPLPQHAEEEPGEPTPPPVAHKGHVDLRHRFPPIRDQGAMGSCVGFGFTALADFLAGARTRSAFTPLALWSLGRQREGSFPRNEGIAMLDGAAILNGLGGLPEASLPYPEGIQERDRGFSTALRTAAAPEQYAAQGLRPSRRVLALRALDQIVPSLDAGLPVVIAIFEPRQFDYPAPGGYVETAGPSVPTENAHCLVVVGYDDPSRRLIVRNSWGRAWGDRGYCYMSYDYITQGYIFQAFTLEKR